MHRVSRVLMLMAFLLLFAGGVSAQPAPVSASYDEITNVISIEFDEVVHSSDGYVVIDGIMVDDDNGGAGADYALRGGSVVNLTDTAPIVQLRPIFGGVVDDYTYTDDEGNEDPRDCWGTDYADIIQLETGMDHTNLRIYLPEGAVMNLDDEASSAGWVDLAYTPTPDGNAVHLTRAEYNADTNVMRFEFDQVMQYDQIAEDIAGDNPINPSWPGPGNGVLDVIDSEDRNGNGVLDFEQNVTMTKITFHDADGNSFTPNSALDITLQDSTVLEMRLSAASQFQMETLDLANLSVTTGSYTFVDVDYNPAVPVTEMDVDYVPESDPVELVSGAYDMGTNQFRVRFDQELGSNVTVYTVVPKIALVKGTGDNEVVTFLSSGRPALSDGDSSVVVTLGLADAQAIETIIDAAPGATYRARVRSNAVLSAGGNGNRLGTQPLTIVEETDNNKAPELADGVIPTYDASTNVLSVQFDIRLENDLRFEGFSFVSETDTIVLGEGEFSRASGNRAVEIILNETDRQLLESNAGKEDMMLHIDPYSVYQQARLNGNREIMSDFDYIPDPNAPLVNYIWYNYLNGELVLGANVSFSPDLVDLTKLTFAGHTLSAADTAMVDDNGRVTFVLTEADAEALNALTADEQLTISVDMAEGVFQNDDGIQSDAAADLVDKAVLTNDVDEQTLLVGYGRHYYVKSREAFPSVTRTIQASLRANSEGAYWYVDNIMWQPTYTVFYGDRDPGEDELFPIVDQPMHPDELAAAVNFFETQSVRDPDRGAREIILDVIGGVAADLVPDKVDIVFTDVFGEYGLGRNDSKDSYWVHGYFDTTDLPGNSDDEMTNNANMFFVDCFPQSFLLDYSEYYSWDSGDGVWEPSSDSNIEALVAGNAAIANLYTELVSYYVDPFEEDWIRKGLAYLSEFLTADDPATAGIVEAPEFYGGGIAKGFGGDNSITFVQPDFNTRVNFQHAFMYFLYVWEKYGNDDVIRSISESPFTGFSSIQRVLDSRAADREEWLADTVDDLYLDFATANLIDTTYGDDHRIYTFDNIIAQRAISGTAWKWKTSGKDKPPYEASCPEDGFSYYFTGYGPFDPNAVLNPHTDDLLLFAGSAASDIKFRKVNVRATTVDANLGGEYLIQDVELDPEVHKGSVPMSPENEDPDWVFGPSGDGNFPTWVLIASGGGSFKATNEDGSATYTQLFVTQNPVLPRKLDMYIISELPLFNRAGVAAPILFASSDAAGSDTLAIFVDADDFEMTSIDNDGGRFVQYLNSIWMANDGSMYWHMDGYYVNGNRVASSDAIGVEVSSLPGGAPGHIGLEDGFALYTTSQSFVNDREVSVIRNVSAPFEMLSSNSKVQGCDAVSGVYSISASSMELKDPGTLVLPYDADAINGQDVGIYFRQNGKWNFIGGNIDEESATISVRIAKLGDYRVLAGTHGDVSSEFMIPDAYALHQNYPNPFNPSTTIHFQLPNTGQVSLIVFDVLGREVVKLLNDQVPFGNHRIVWDGKSASGAPLSSGVYFVRMNASGFHDVKKMVLVK
ncbi:T9SS type A sorting domain-containing protein [bacterium]|nr:T9SS type A sorting domain-containing protein [bacterium]